MQFKIEYISKKKFNDRDKQGGKNHSCNQKKLVGIFLVQQTETVKYDTAAKKHAVMRMAAKEELDGIIGDTAKTKKKECFQ